MRDFQGKGKRMYDPAADSIMDTVRKLNEVARRARSGEPAVDDYLKVVAADPVTEWFTVLLREKNEELEREKKRADQLAAAGRRWFADVSSRLADNQCSAAEADLANLLRDLSII